MRGLVVLLLLCAGAHADALCDRLKEGSAAERAFVARLLGEFGDRRDTGALVQALRDPEASVRLAAARALGFMRDPRAYQPLQGALGDADPEVRKAAGLAMRGIEGSAASATMVVRKRPELSVVGLRSGNAKWQMLVEGKSATVTDGRLRLEAREDKPRCDYLQLPQAPDRVAYEAAVLVEAGRARLGFVERVGRYARFFNRFQLANGAIAFRGSLDARPVELGKYEAGAWVVLRAELDFARRRADLWVNGERVKQNVPIQPREFRAGRRGRVALTKWGAWVSKSGALQVDRAWVLAVSWPRGRVPRRRPPSGASEVEALLKQLDDPDGNVRHRAVVRLGKLEDPRVVPALIRALADRDVNVRRSAAYALGDRGDERAKPALLKALAAWDADERGPVVRALGVLRAEEAVEPMLEMLARGGRIAYECANALANYGADVAPRLIALLGKAGAAGRALEKIGAPAVPMLIAALEGGKTEAMGVLAAIKDERAVAPLHRILRGDASARMRANAARALGSFKGGVEPLVAALEDEESDVRCAAAESLGRVPDPRAVAPLQKALGHEDAQFRIIVASALGRQPGAVDALLVALRDDHPMVRETAIMALGRQDDERAVDALLTLLRSKEARLRRNATWALGSSRSERALVPLVAALRDPHHEVRRGAAVALERRKWSPDNRTDWMWFLVARGRCRQAAKMGEAAIEPLMTAMRSPDPSLRQDARAALVSIGEAAVAPLRRAVEETGDPGVQRDASRALADLGWKPGTEAERVRAMVRAQRWKEVVALGPVAIGPLAEALRTKSENVRYAAALALKKLGYEPPDKKARAYYLVALGRCDEVGVEGVDALLLALQGADPHSGHAREAVEALAKLKDAGAVEALIEALRSGPKDARMAAAECLGRFRDPRALAPLVAALRHSDLRVHAFAARGLGDLGDPRAIPPLRETLERAEKLTRAQGEGAEPFVILGEELACSAAAALVKLGEPKPLERLLAALRHREPRVRAQAARLIGWIGPAAMEAEKALVRTGTDEARQALRMLHASQVAERATLLASINGPPFLEIRKGARWTFDVGGGKTAAIEVLEVYRAGLFKVGLDGFPFAFPFGDAKTMYWRAQGNVLLWTVEDLGDWAVAIPGGKLGAEWLSVLSRRENRSRNVAIEKDGSVKVEHDIEAAPFLIHLWWKKDVGLLRMTHTDRKSGETLLDWKRKTG